MLDARSTQRVAVEGLALERDPQLIVGDPVRTDAHILGDPIGVGDDRIRAQLGELHLQQVAGQRRQIAEQQIVGLAEELPPADHQGAGIGRSLGS